jgi:hypothetical protein
MHPNAPPDPQHPGVSNKLNITGGAKSECYTTTATGPGWGQIRRAQWSQFRVLRPFWQNLAREDHAITGPPSPDPAQLVVAWVGAVRPEPR